MLFDKFVTVEQRTSSGLNNYAWVPLPALGTIPVNIQPMQTEFGVQQGIATKKYRLFTTASGIVEDMRLTVTGTNEQFIVRGRQRFDYIVAPHYELVVEGAAQ